MGNEQFLRGLWEYFTLKREGARTNQADGAQEKLEGKQAQWQQQPPVKEVLEQIKRSADTDWCPRQPGNVSCPPRNEEWSLGGFLRKNTGRKESSLNGPFERIREACEKVAMNDIGRLGIAQEILRKSTDFLRRIIAPVRRNGRESLCRTFARIATVDETSMSVTTTTAVA